jgi:phosphate-selective porin
VEYTKSFKAAFGAAFAINNGTEIFFSDELQTFSKDAQFMQFGLDSIMKYRGFSLQGEYHLRRLDRRGFNRDTANGFFVQGGYFPVPKRLEIVARYAQFDPDVNVSENFKKEFALGTNWYFSKNHHHKLQANVTRVVTDNPANDKEDTLISIMHQLEW